MFVDLQFAFLITAPVFFILAAGVVFKRLGWINDAFAKTGSDLVFKVTLPCMLFVKLVETNFRHDLPVLLVLYAVVATVLVFVVLDRLVTPLIARSTDRGVFVQGAFRSNMGVIGLAFCLSAFGEAVIAAASIYLAVLTVLYNILAVLTLSRHHAVQAQPKPLHSLLFDMLKNPLILSISAGVLVSLSGVKVPVILLNTGGYLAQMTLPLALLCAGASIRLQEFQASPPLYWATAAKLFMVPLLVTLGGIAIGLRGDVLGVLYLMSSAPTAAASYPMTLALGGNHHLAAAIVAATSLGSLLSTTVGIFVLRSLEMI